MYTQGARSTVRRTFLMLGRSTSKDRLKSCASSLHRSYRSPEILPPLIPPFSPRRKVENIKGCRQKETIYTRAER